MKKLIFLGFVVAIFLLYGSLTQQNGIRNVQNIPAPVPTPVVTPAPQYQIPLQRPRFRFDGEREGGDE